MKDARYTAVQALVRMSEQKAYSTLALDALLKKNELEGRDAAFASALFYGTLERRLTVDHILRAHCSRRLKELSPVVLEILRIGVYQLVWMDGVEDYAAVSESVALTRAFSMGKASGFVNGVLRSFLRAKKLIPPVQGTPAEQLEKEFSCPAWLIEEWIKAYGEMATRHILSSSLGKAPLYLRVNTLSTTSAALIEQLATEGVTALLVPALEGCLLVEGQVIPERLQAFSAGLFHVQDKASQLCAQAVGARAGERVLDLCAAPGGKSFTLAQWMENKGQLVARDLHENRVHLIASGAKRLNIANIDASCHDASIFDCELGLFDRVLCDVPCSGFGSIRHKPEIKYKTREQVKDLPRVQYKILQTAAQYCRPGGTLVYSTCTLLPAENERVIERFLKRATQFSCVSQRTYTGQEQDSDGFFVCVMVRAEEEN